ncbi:MAG: N-acetyltransferase [Rhodobiaceae bacterium]|nr:N-acetyltransferase [Rhodobiaceae bacterium]
MSCLPILNPTLHSTMPEDAEAIEALLDLAFGPGRTARTAYRIREQSGEDPALAFVARLDGVLVGTIAFAPITVGDQPARLLGPLAVAPDLAGRGIGLKLLRHGVAAAHAAGHRTIVLVGDLDYYARVGFRRIPPGRVEFPGPVDPLRLLWLPDGADNGEPPSGPLLPELH